MRWLKITPIIIILFVASISSIQLTLASEPMLKSYEDITHIKEWRLFSFYDVEYVYRMTLRFCLNGSVIVSDNCGNNMKINILQFEVSHSPFLQTGLFRNSSHVLQSYEIRTPSNQTIMLTDAYYDLRLDKNVKITLIGSGLANATLKLHFRTTRPLVTIENKVHAGLLGYDWSDAEDIGSFNETENCLVFNNLSESFFIDPKIITSVSGSSAIRDVFQRKSFYAQGRYWIFYCNSSNIVYRSSTDGESWSSEDNATLATDGYHFSLWYNETTISYADATAGSLYYRCGTPQSDGSIVWFAAEQELTDLVHNCWPSITLDSEGYPWIGVVNSSMPGYEPYVLKSKWNNGSWLTDVGFPYKLSTESCFAVGVVPLTSQKIYSVYSKMTYDRLYGKLYSAGWGAEETIFSGSMTLNSFSMVAVDDTVHVIVTQPTQLSYSKRIGGTWTAKESVYDDEVLGQLTKDDEDVYISYTRGNKICVQARYANGSSSSAEITCSYGYEIEWLQAYYQVFDNKNALLYMEQTGSTYKLWWAEPTFGELWTEPTPPGSETSETIKPKPLIELPKIKVPEIPVWGYWMIAGVVGVVAVGALVTAPVKKSRKTRGVKAQKSAYKYKKLAPSKQKRLPKRNKKSGRFQ